MAQGSFNHMIAWQNRQAIEVFVERAVVQELLTQKISW